ncbi:protein translocase subunit SecF [Candidatus Bipolaricaulota bacterium]|jgi:preprotein translocase subunit SecF|nr:protein translocase subunit SecF [Candidatus Bipolaricaulota bacterium]TFH09117.1 MAG: protein translocase subunit SecF [Candidatus Atribacteria bacterium]
MRQFDFLGKTKIFLPISLVLILISMIVLIPGIRGLRMGIDFTGGMEFEVLFTGPEDIADIRSKLGTIDAGDVDLTTSVIQDAEGNKKVITLQLDDSQIADEIVAMLQANYSIAEDGISRSLIGQQVSKTLAEKGWQSVLLALLAILVYISWRFRLRYAVGAVAAVLHDVIIALGLFAIFQVEVNLATIAAFLTIVGYSLNDTIVIYDRIRENLKIERRKTVFEIINHSVNQSLSRTLNTSITTFIPVIILFLFGGSVLRGFSLALLIGVIVGTYSSMYIANPILYAWTMKAGGVKTAK